MGDEFELKGVRLRTDGLSPESRAYIDGKLRRILRGRRRGAALLNRLFRSLVPADYRRDPVEAMLEGRGRVLVVGCSAGIETLALGATNEVAVGMDIDRAALRVAGELEARAGPEFRGARFLAASGAQLPFRDGAFNALLSDNVVEHIPDGPLRRHLAEARRVLRPGGFYVMTTPNAAYERPARDGHVSLHTYAEWEALLREAGFGRIETPRRRSGPLGDLEWKKARETRPRALGSGNRGLRMVVLRATRA